MLKLPAIPQQFIRSVPLRTWKFGSIFTSRQVRFYSDSPSPPRILDDGERSIFDKLTKRFSPSQLQVQDVSGGCGTFYAITISSSAFKGIPVVKQHRLVTEELKKEIADIHGLQIKTIAE